LKYTPGSVKYEMSKLIPGLEILLADDNIHVETVWKDGDDLRAAVSDLSVRQKVKTEIDEAVEASGEETPAVDSEPGVEDISEYERREKLAAKREFEGYSWRRVINGADGGLVEQPPGVEFIPLRDATVVPPTQEQWKARFGDTEIRAGSDGLYKVTRGKITRLRSSFHTNPIVTPNGRWVVVYKYDPETGPSLSRINLATNKEFKVDVPEYSSFYPYAFVPTLNKMLIVEQSGEDEHGEEFEAPEIDDTIGADPGPSEMMLLTPDTGVVQPISGEFRPLAQQTFRPLQKSAKLNEFWAAIPDLEKNETEIGIYDIKAFGFKPVLSVPKMTFNSMSMWVDEPGKSVYFVYRGHLLRLPMPK